MPRRMTRHADDLVGPEQRARLGVRRILLAHMHAVGIEPLREIRAVVDDERNPRPLRDRHQSFARAQNLVVGIAL